MNIETIKRKLLIKYPLFGSIVASTNIIEDNNTKTASTDGDNIYYNKNFLSKLDDEEQVFTFVHEICHIAFNHILRSEGKNQELWNIATDSVINALLKNDGLKLIKGVIDIPIAINYTAEEMYEKLLNKEIEQPKNNRQGQDDHSLWDKVVERKNKQSEETLNKDQSQSTNWKEDTIQKLTEMGEIDTFKQNKIEKKRKANELMEELARKSYGAEKQQIRITNIVTSKQLIDWRRLLKETTQYNIDFSYRNASIENGVLNPYLEEFPTPETEILLDTSGSISKTLLRNFLGECKNILPNSKIKVGCFDDEFYGFTEIRNEKDIDKMNFIGGGGTDFNVAVSSFTRRVENKIIFTDGKSNMPKKKLDIIWIVFGNIKINPPGGKVIYIDQNSLQKLYLYHNQNMEENYMSRR